MFKDHTYVVGYFDHTRARGKRFVPVSYHTFRFVASLEARSKNVSEGVFKYRVRVVK